MILLSVLLTLALSCQSQKADSANAGPAEARPSPKAEAATELSQAAVKEKLTAMGVTLAPARGNEMVMPNPFTLQIKFAAADKYILNVEKPQDWNALSAQLAEIKKDREKNQLADEKVNQAYLSMKLIIPASQSQIEEYKKMKIRVEDFESLVDKLQKAGYKTLELDLNEPEKPMEEVTLPPAPKPNGKP